MEKDQSVDLGDIIREEIGDRLWCIRKLNGLTQDQFADLIGIGTTGYGKWESGQHWPDLPILITVCSRFKVNFEYLIRGDDDRLEKKLADQLDFWLTKRRARKLARS